MKENQVATLCRIRDIYRSIGEFEQEFEQQYGLCLNEGMLLCSLNSNKYSSSQIAELLGLSNSNASKVIKLVENKKLIERAIGADDKRQMYFTLTKEGTKKLKAIKCGNLNIPELLKSVLTE